MVSLLLRSISIGWVYRNEPKHRTKSKDNVLAIGEKPQHFLPVIADVDLKIESKSEEIPKKLYTQSHIIKTVETYQSVLRNIIDDCTDENLILVPHIKHTLEQALEFIEDDELVEVTPESIRLRKKGRVRT